MTRVGNAVRLGMAALLLAAPALMMASKKSPPTLEEQVRHQLAMNPYYNLFDNLAFQMSGQDVTLLGQVTNPVVKKDAENMVKGIPGIGIVKDEIQVLPPSPIDYQIRRQEARAIYRYDSLSRYAMGAVPQIHIIVDNGHVTLTGVVDNKMDREVAGIRANTVPGVFSVTNDLVVSKS